MQARTQRTTGRTATVVRTPQAVLSQRATALARVGHATIRRAEVRRATPRELQTMLLAEYLDDAAFEFLDAPAPDVDSSTPEDAEDELDFDDSPDNDIDAEVPGEPESEELAAFEAFLQDDQNLEFDASPPLTYRMGDWYVLRIDPNSAKPLSNLCVHVAKPWMRQAPKKSDGQSLGNDVHGLRDSLDRMAKLFTERLPIFLSDPQPDNLLNDWRTLQRLRGAEFALRQRDTRAGADVPHNIESLNPSEKLAFAELVFDEALSAERGPARRAEFGDLVEHVLLLWSVTGQTMPMRMLFENEAWLKEINTAWREGTKAAP